MGMGGHELHFHFFLHRSEFPIFRASDELSTGFKRIRACLSASAFIIMPMNIESTSNRMRPMAYAISVSLTGEDSLILNAAGCEMLERSKWRLHHIFKQIVVIMNHFISTYLFVSIIATFEAMPIAS